MRWARPFLGQLEQFPNSEFKDYTDTFTQAVIYLRDAGLLALIYVEDEEPPDIDYEERKRSAKNPYFA